MSNLNPTVRLARLPDLAAILAIDRMSQTATHWGEELYRDILSHPPDPRSPLQRLSLVATIDDVISGFTVASATRSSGDITVELESIVVGEVWQRRGVGRHLCHGILGWATDLGAAVVDLEVRAASPAVALYSSLGFSVVGRRRGYYRDPVEDALLMRLHL